jgi:hypothetical protein
VTEVETSGYTEISTIYIPKETIKQHDIDPEKGFYLIIEKNIMRRNVKWVMLTKMY